MKRRAKLGIGVCLSATLACAVWFVSGDTSRSGLTADKVPTSEWASQSPILGAAKLVSGNDFEPSKFAQLKTQVVGRTTTNSHAAGNTNFQSGFTHQWPSIYATARFSGGKVIVAFDDALNTFRITIDSAKDHPIWVSKPGIQVLEIDGLGPGHHEIRVEKTSESLSGSARFLGIFAPSDENVLEPAKPSGRQIEIIGDSDAVGYGNTSPSRKCTGDEVYELTNTYESFGPLVARHYDADHQMIASSGIGFIRSLDGWAADTIMQHRYNKTLFENSVEQTPSDWSPNAVVFALGSNDFTNDIASGEPWSDKEALREDFETEYRQFIQDLRSRYPDALFVLILMKDYSPHYIEAHKNIHDDLKSIGDDQIVLVTIPKMEKTGCHWHPSLSDHRMIAEHIIHAIDAQPHAVWD